MPKTTSLPPRWNRTAMAWQAAATSSAWAARSRTGASLRSKSPATASPGTGLPPADDRATLVTSSTDFNVRSGHMGRGLGGVLLPGRQLNTVGQLWEHVQRQGGHF